MSADIESIGEIYKETILQTKESLINIIKNDIKMKDTDSGVFVSVLEQAMEKIVGNWLSGKKYMRTLFMKNAMGDSYPQNIMKLSLSIDAIINILDDILDEDLDKNTKTAYIIEIIRILAIFSSKIENSRQREKIENYFNKIISIAIGESIYKNLIKNEIDREKILNMMIEIYTCRSLDMDIFVELPLLETSLGPDDINKILTLSRYFRILNLIKKDIDDIEHDKKSDIDTGITLALEKEKPLEIINSITNKIVSNSKQINLYREQELIDNFKEMIEHEKTEIEKRLEKINF